MRLRRSHAILLAVALVASALSACTPGEEPAKLRFGTLPTEDTLPLWVAEKEGLLEKAGLDVEILTFQSAQERDAALTAKAIDGFMGDIIAAAQLRQGEQPVKLATVMLGATPAEGRFGVVGSPKGGPASLKDAAGVPVGTSSGTIQEYVLDGLMAEAEVEAARVKKEEVKKVPVRFELLMQGQLKAAALPEPFLSLAEKSGARLLADDTEGDRNLSQTAMVVSEEFITSDGGAETLDRLLGVWDQAVELINADPAKYRGLLAEKARLPEPLKAEYQVNTYPKAQLPKAEDVNAVLEWMRGKGLLRGDAVDYGALVWQRP